MATLEDLKSVLESIDNSMIEQKGLLSNLITMQETRDRLSSADTDVTNPQDGQRNNQNPSNMDRITSNASEGLGIGLGGIAAGAGGLIGLGAGVAGFMAALSVGSIGLDWLGADYTGLSSAFASFSDAMENLSPAAITALAGASAIAATTASFKNLYGLGTASGMVGLGAGISGFLAGLSLGEIGLSWLGNDYTNLGGALASFSESIGKLSAEAVGVLGGIAAIAVANTALGGNAKSLALSMAGVSAGIAGFMLGLTLTDVGIGWITSLAGSDGSGLASAFKIFNDSISELSPTSIVALGAMAVAASTLPKFSPADFAKNMTGLGIGISGFMAGLAAGDVGIEWINAVPAGSGEGLVSAFKIFNDAIMALSPTAMAALGVLMAAAGPLGGSVATGLPLIGVGIAGFMSSLAAGDTITSLLSMATGGEPGAAIRSLFTNIFEGIGAANALSGIDLIGLGAGLTSVAAGLAAFGVGTIINGLADAATSIISFFTGSETPFEQIMKIADKSEELTKGGEALDKLASSLAKIGSLNFDGSKLNIKAFAEELAESIPVIESAIMGGTIEKFGPFNDIQFKGLASPEIDYSSAIEKINQLKEALGINTETPTIEGPSVTVPNTYTPPNTETVTGGEGSNIVTGNASVDRLSQSIAAAVAESPVISPETERLMTEAQARNIRNFQERSEIVENKNKEKEQPVSIVDSSSRTDARTFVGGTTNTTIITPRQLNDLDYGLPRSVQ